MRTDALPLSDLRVRGAIALRLLAAFAALLALFGAMALIAFSSARQTAAEIARVERSLNQLELARAVEAAFNRYLLREIGRRLEDDGDTSESREAALLRGVLLSYRRAIDVGLTEAGQSELQAARGHMLRARSLMQLFDVIETESMLDRRARGSGADAARDFLTRIAGERDGVFRSLLVQTLEEERAAAEAAYDRLDELRAGMALRGGLLALGFLLAAAAAGVIFYRSLIAPIRALSVVAEAFGGGARTARAPADLPGEFSVLSHTFNAMAERIGGEQQRLETEVAARTAALRQVDETRRQFFANVSHELRTPVTVLLGEARVALRGADPQAHREALERIAASGGYLKRRLDDLLSLARSEDGALTLRMGSADLNAVVAAAVETVRAYAAANEIALEFQSVADDAAVGGDSEALRQAALALLDNAVKFSPPGGVVRAEVFAGPGRVGFSVADRGPGFQGVDADALFDRYAQAKEGRRAGGAGLGLSIVRWIAEQHGGAVTADNRDGGGAVVTLTLRRP
jgi:two-component system OmpR family sensor kinase